MMPVLMLGLGSEIVGEAAVCGRAWQGKSLTTKMVSRNNEIRKRG